MLNGAAVMDAALLLIAANEPCPQPQTSEHLAAIEIMKLKHILVLQVRPAPPRTTHADMRTEQGRPHSRIPGGRAPRLDPLLCQGHRRRLCSHHPYLCPATLQHRRPRRVHCHQNSCPRARLFGRAQIDCDPKFRRQQAGSRGAGSQGRGSGWIAAEGSASCRFLAPSPVQR